MTNFYEGLNHQQKSYFDHYKSNDPYLNSPTFAWELNEMLRNGDLKSEWQSAVDIIDQIVALNKINEAIVVYRVTGLSVIQPFIKDDKLIYPAFLSTGGDLEAVRTHFKSVDTMDTPVLCFINCPVETAIAPFENATSSETEKEMLLGRGHAFLIQSDETVVERSRLDEIMDKDMAADFDKLRVVKLVLTD